MKNVHVIEHPLLQHRLNMMRDERTVPSEFRRHMFEASRLMAYEMWRDLKTKTVKISTPLEETKVKLIDQELCVISIMRAGNGMLDAFLDVLPFSSVGHIGIYRDKFVHSTIEYYFRLPKVVKNKPICLVDPLLATGATIIAAVERLKQYDVGPIRLACLIAAPEGIKQVHEVHPDLKIYTLSIDRKLNEKGYILPGVGDAGDRLYNTVDH